ncbi:MAG: anti-sigma factor family protein [Sulfuriferula sp.]
MLNCQETTCLLSESQERTLTVPEHMSLKMHMIMCSGCRNFEKQISTLRQAARAYAKRTDDSIDKTSK